MRTRRACVLACERHTETESGTVCYEWETYRDRKWYGAVCVRDIQRQKVVRCGMSERHTETESGTVRYEWETYRDRKWYGCGIHIVHLNASKAMIITAILLAACWTSQKEYSNGKYSTSLAGSLPPYPQEVTQRWKILLPVNLFPYLRNASRDSAAWST